MKKQNGARNAEGATKTVRQPHVAHEHEANGPSQDEIRQRAFEIHIARGGIYGCDLDDWLQAERELQTNYDKNETDTSKP